MNRADLLQQYFSLDVSGSTLASHYIRTNPFLLTKSKSMEFTLIMDTLFPDWTITGMIPGTFILEGIDYEEDGPPKLCICTQCIKDICYLKHPVLEHSVQVGNVCVAKISEELSKQASKLFREKKVRLKQEKQIELDRIYRENSWLEIALEEENTRIVKQEMEENRLRASLVEQEIQDFFRKENERLFTERYRKRMEEQALREVAQKEKERLYLEERERASIEEKARHDRVMERMRLENERLLEESPFRECIGCNKRVVLKTSPRWMVRCLKCWKLEKDK